MSSTFDADLARANLLRLRGDFKKAEDICLNILKTYPNSAATHTLLGDIYSDQGRLEQAAQWYELSLDLDPSSWQDQQKLEDMREQIKERDHISAIEQLGLPESKPWPVKWILSGAVCVIVVGCALGYAIKLGQFDGDNKPQVIKKPIKAVVENIVPNMPGLEPRATPGLAINQPTMNPAGDGVKNEVAFPMDDDELKKEVVAVSKYGDRVLTVAQDLRTKVTTLEFSSVTGDDQRTVAADLAKAVFQVSKDPETVLLKAMKDNKLMYQAEAPRGLYADTLTDDWKDRQLAEDAWIAHMLTNEVWAKPGESIAEKSGSGDSAEAATTGDGAKADGAGDTAKPAGDGAKPTGGGSSAGISANAGN